MPESSACCAERAQSPAKGGVEWDRAPAPFDADVPPLWIGQSSAQRDSARDLCQWSSKSSLSPGASSLSGSIRSAEGEGLWLHTRWRRPSCPGEKELVLDRRKRQQSPFCRARRHPSDPGPALNSASDRSDHPVALPANSAAGRAESCARRSARAIGCR